MKLLECSGAIDMRIDHVSLCDIPRVKVNGFHITSTGTGNVTGIFGGDTVQKSVKGIKK